MTKIDLLNLLTRNAKDYQKHAADSVIRNNHMNKLNKESEINKDVIDAILVDFINYVGAVQGVDYGLYTSDLYKND